MRIHFKGFQLEKPKNLSAFEKRHKIYNKRRLYNIFSSVRTAHKYSWLVLENKKRGGKEKIWKIMGIYFLVGD